MEPEMNAHAALAYVAWLLLQLLSAPNALYLPQPSEEEEEDQNPMLTIGDDLWQPIDDGHAEIRAAVHNFRLCTSLNVFDDDLGFWVKPRSTTWFSRFLLNEYDDTRWVQMFRLTKSAVFTLADILRPSVRRKDTKYRLAIPVVIRVACCLFKLIHGASLFICSEMFAIGKSTVSSILRDIVHAINDTLRHELMWPVGDRLRQTQEQFYDLCGLPAIVGAIDDVIFACAILHNMLLGQSHEDVENLLHVLRAEGLDGEVMDGIPSAEDGGDIIVEAPLADLAVDKRTDLGLFLSMQRMQQQQ